MVTPYKNLFLIVLSLLFAHANAQQRVSKVIEKSFQLNNSGELQLENKYGDIHITGWEQEKVSIKIDISVNHRKMENAEDLLERIQPQIKSTTNYISVISEILSKKAGWFPEFFNQNNPIETDRGKIEIDYEVFIPNKAILKVNNRFGDVVIENWSGKLESDINHGDLWINENLIKASIALKFGKLKAKDLNFADLNLKNSELSIENTKSLKLNCSGSDITINTIGSLEIYSNKDVITIGKVDAIYGDLKFSTLNLEQLNDKVDLSMKLTDFRVNNVLTPKCEIVITQESSDVLINVTNFSHKFYASVEEGLVRLPKTFQNVNSKMLNNTKKQRKIEATFGASLLGKITINGIKGIVTLKEFKSEHNLFSKN